MIVFIEWTNMELEKTVRMMERNVMAMEAGNHETDDSDAKQKYEGQKQLNIQVGSHWSILTTILSSHWSS